MFCRCTRSCWTNSLIKIESWKIGSKRKSERMSANWVNNTAILSKAPCNKRCLFQTINTVTRHFTTSKPTHRQLIIAQLVICKVSCTNLSPLCLTLSILKISTGIAVCKTWQIILFPRRQTDHSYSRNSFERMRIADRSLTRPTESLIPALNRRDCSHNSHGVWITRDRWLMCR